LYHPVVLAYRLSYPTAALEYPVVLANRLPDPNAAL